MSTDVIIALSAVIVALAAFFLSIWQGIQTVRYNRLSVRPHLRFDTVSVPDQPIALLMTNTGIGPGIITDVQVFADGRLIDFDPFSALSTAKDSVGLAAFEWTCELPVPGDVLAQDEQMKMLAFPNSASESAERRKILQEISRLTITIGYKSMYNDAFRMEGVPKGPVGKNVA